MDTSQTRRRRKKDNAINKDGRSQRLVARGGMTPPLAEDQIQKIHLAALEILDDIGLADAPDEVIDLLTPHGARLSAHNRLLLSPDLIQKAMDDLPKTFTLFGRNEQHNLELGKGFSYPGSGGASPQILAFDDNKKAEFRPSTLCDLYQAAQLVDALPHIQFFARSLVAGDMPDAKSLDINTAYACFRGTKKPVLTAASSPEHAQEVIEMAAMIAGSYDALRKKPFFGFNINHVVPPLRLDTESCLVLIKAVQAGIPVMVNTFGQLGASSPVTLAGCLAQTMAETLAGMVIAWAVDPQAKAVFGPRPMITDLRTGGMAGGGGEQALLTAASAQMAWFYGWPSSTIAGASDSKIPDVQSGYEKAMNITMAIAGGIDLVTQAAGTQAGLMAASLETYVIDNDMLGAIIRSCQKPEINSETLAIDDIRVAVTGEGHFLGQGMTMNRMHSDFTYPDIADRSSIEEWVMRHQPDQIIKAKNQVKDLLSAPKTSPIPDHIDQLIRDRFDIHLQKP